MYGYIYKITNTINNKIYIGRHKAATVDEKYWGSGLLIKRAIAAYGEEYFSREILAWAKNNKELNNLEIFYIAKYKATNPEIGYNIAIGGGAPMAGRIKIIKNEKYKFIDPAFLELFKDAGWTVPDKQAIKKRANAKYRQTHKDKIKKYKQTHKDKIKEAKKKNRQKHPEQQAARNKRHYEKHKAQLKEYYKNYFKQHEHKISAEKNRLAQQKYMANPENRAKHNARQRERRRLIKLQGKN